MSPQILGVYLMGTGLLGLVFGFFCGYAIGRLS